MATPPVTTRTPLHRAGVVSDMTGVPPESPMEPADGTGRSGNRRPDGPRSRWRSVLVWLERAAWVAVGVFLLVRLGPQLGALTGVGPTLGRAPQLTVATLAGDTLTSGELRGRVVVLNFWATWCLPCRLEMPALQGLHEDYAGSDVAVVGLATDVGGVAPVRAFLEERTIEYPVGRATPAHRSAFGGIRGIPTTFVIDRQGVVRHRVVGYFAPPAMRAAVNRLLEEPSP